MSSAYIKALKRNVDAAGLEIAAQPGADLETRFLTWLDSQPEISRIRPYSMSEMEAAVQTQGRYLSRILLKNGWQRKRKWTSRTQYLRYWVPPEMS